MTLSIFHRRIFEIVRRLQTRDPYPGTGIGFAIAGKVVERHGGTVGVESVRGRARPFLSH